MGLLLLLLFSAHASSLTSAASPDPLRGVSPQDEAYYRGLTIPCKDGSKTFLRERLNDDFCDCLDGTDEPGTSACPDGKFYCRNIGQTPLLIFSSRVNDGICGSADCSDGSDEYNGKVKCPRTLLAPPRDTRLQLTNETKADIFLTKQDIGLVERINQQADEEVSRLTQEKKPQRMIESFKDLKLVLVVEMVFVFILLWWKGHCWKQQAKLRRRRKLPR